MEIDPALAISAVFGLLALALYLMVYLTLPTSKYQFSKKTKEFIRKYI